MRAFNLVNINTQIGVKVVILADMYQVMPWSGAVPLVSALEDAAYLGFVLSGTYSVTSITGEVGEHRVYEITGPM